VTAAQWPTVLHWILPSVLRLQGQVPTHSATLSADGGQGLWLLGRQNLVAYQRRCLCVPYSAYLVPQALQLVFPPWPRPVDSQEVGVVGGARPHLHNRGTTICRCCCECRYLCRQMTVEAFFQSVPVHRAVSVQVDCAVVQQRAVTASCCEVYFPLPAMTSTHLAQVRLPCYVPDEYILSHA
jgi:hypothetical protein